jgi:hypothetical protein
MSDKFYTCKACGRENKMVDKFCGNCGVENMLRLEIIAKLESESKQYERDSGKLREPYKRALLRDTIPMELAAGGLIRKSRKLRLEKSRLETGGTHEGKLLWVKKQLDLKRSIPEIADDLCVSMNTVAKLIDEIKNQKKE